MTLRGLFFIFTIFATTTPLFARPVEPKKKYIPQIFEVTPFQLPGGEVTYINGMNHKPERAIKCARMLSENAGGYNVYTVYNPTSGFIQDLCKCFVELYHFKATEPVKKLHEKWDKFFRLHSNKEKLLQFCHSQGTIQVRNALLGYPPHLRKRIIVVAIAPAAYIPDFICCGAFHYVSRRDIVPNLDSRGRKWCREKTILLTPHRNAAFFDHHFLSPTFKPAIEYHLQKYLHEECWLGTSPLEMVLNDLRDHD